jgi:TPR repeat protein
MYFGYAIAVNPAAAYQAQYQAMLMQSLQKEIGQLKAESLKDDYQRGYEALIRGDTEKAIRLWEKESNLGVTQASKALGDIFHFKTKELSKALVYYGKAAEFGDLESAALMLAAKYHLDKLELTDLYAQPSSVQDQPWAKYVQACLIAETSEIDEDSDIWDLLTEAIEAGIVQAITRCGILMSNLGLIEEALEMFLLASDNGDNLALVELIKIELSRDRLLEATEAVIIWEAKYEWDNNYSYDICSLLRFMNYIPKVSAGKSETVSKLVNSASRLWYGKKMFDTAWDLFEQEIVRPQHNLSSIQLKDLYIAAYQIEGKQSARVAEMTLLMIVANYCGTDAVEKFLKFEWLHPILNDLLNLTSELFESNEADLETVQSNETSERVVQMKFVESLLDALYSEDWNAFRNTYRNGAKTPEAVRESAQNVIQALS